MPNTSRTCPVCFSPLTPLDFNGVETDLCRKGCGVWLDEGELEAVEGSDSLERIDAAFPGAFEKADVKKSLKETPGRQCPADQTPLHRYEWNLGSGLVFDGCPACQGLWLDAGELEGYSRYIRQFMAEPPELSPEIQARMQAVKRQVEAEWDASLEETARRVVPWDLWFLDDLKRVLLKRTMRRFEG